MYFVTIITTSVAHPRAYPYFWMASRNPATGIGNLKPHNTSSNLKLELQLRLIYNNVDSKNQVCK